MRDQGGRHVSHLAGQRHPGAVRTLGASMRRACGVWVCIMRYMECVGVGAMDRACTVVETHVHASRLPAR